MYSLKNRKFLRIHFDSGGYRHVSLYVNGIRITRKLHVLVARAFIPNPLGKCEVNHIDCDKSNNNVTNLEWVTKRENIQHALLRGRCDRTNQSPLHEEQVRILPYLVGKGFSIKLLSKLYKVSMTTIREIITGKTWRKLNLQFNRVPFDRGIIEIDRAIYNKLKSYNIDNAVLNSRIKVLESV